MNLQLVLLEQLLIWVTSWNYRSPGFQKSCIIKTNICFFPSLVSANMSQRVKIIQSYSYLKWLRMVLWLFFFGSREENAPALCCPWSHTFLCNRWIMNVIHRGFIWNKQSMCWRGLRLKKREQCKRIMKYWNALVDRNYPRSYDFVTYKIFYAFERVDKFIVKSNITFGLLWEAFSLTHTSYLLTAFVKILK